MIIIIKLIIKRFIPDYENVSAAAVREKYGILAGILGIICNLILFVVKLFSGMILGSVAVISDAFNNLSDMGSSVISIISAKLSGKAPDRDHPFGHGRIEYIASLVISFLILMVGVELFKGSFEKILHPAEINKNITVLIVLGASVLVKLWMFSYNRYVGKTVSSATAEATATDSLGDAVATTAVIAATVIGIATGLKIDGYIGVAVSLLILKGGLSTAVETVGVLLGKPPKPETVDALEAIITGKDGICGIHDLIVHDYGPGRIFASVHAEVPDDVPAMVSHEIIDALECEVLEKTGIELVIHMDPIAVSSEETNTAKRILNEILKEKHPDCSVHDIRITEGEERVNVIFDLVVSPGISEDDIEKIKESISSSMKEHDHRYVCVIKVDIDYAGRNK